MCYALLSFMCFQGCSKHGKQGCSFSLTSSLHSELDSSVLIKIQVCLFWG